MQSPAHAAPRIGRFVAIATLSTLAVHALPLALGVAVSLPLLSIALLASFFVGHPAMSVPLYVELRAASARGASRRALAAAAIGTGFASGILVVLSHLVVEVFVRGERFASIELVPMLVHPAVSTLFAAVVGALAARSGEGAA